MHIVITGEQVECAVAGGEERAIPFAAWDGETYSTINLDVLPERVFGTLTIAKGKDQLAPPVDGDQTNAVYVVLCPSDGTDAPRSNAGALVYNGLLVKGYVWKEETWQEAGVETVHIRKDEIYSRHMGLLNTDVFAGQVVLVISTGSVGSEITTQLGCTGIENLIVVEPQRIGVENPVRHRCGFSDVGRLKTDYQAGQIRDKNPFAKVVTHAITVCGETKSLLRDMVRQSSIVVVTADERPCRRLINRLCVEENKPAIYAGCFTRAFGGQVLRVRPYESMCYRCFELMLPEQSRDIEISSARQVRGAVYTDRPVDESKIQPGLVLDIFPICHMAAKLAIQELLRGKDVPALNSLHEDLSYPWYIWLNRRAEQYKDLPPMGRSPDAMQILAWHGIDAKRHPHCDVCGDYADHIRKCEGVTGTE